MCGHKSVTFILKNNIIKYGLDTGGLYPNLVPLFIKPFIHDM